VLIYILFEIVCIFNPLFCYELLMAKVKEMTELNKIVFCDLI